MDAEEKAAEETVWEAIYSYDNFLKSHFEVYVDAGGTLFIIAFQGGNGKDYSVCTDFEASDIANFEHVETMLHACFDQMCTHLRNRIAVDCAI